MKTVTQKEFLAAVQKNPQWRMENSKSYPHQADWTEYLDGGPGCAAKVVYGFNKTSYYLKG